MKTIRCSAIVSLVVMIAASSFAQQPAAPVPASAAPAAGAPAGAAPAGRGGRGGGGAGGAAAAPAAPPLPLAQRIAIGQMNDSLTDAVANAAAAVTALTRASLALPRDQAAIAKRATELGTAELALATARAAAFQKLQSGPGKLAADQMTAVTGGGGRGGRGGGALPYNDYTGFTSIFDGKTLNGWDGETDVFIVQDGAIFMNVMRPGANGQHHLHYVGGPGLPPKVFGDFDFKFEFKQSANGNGGVQYHSRLLSAAHSTDGKARGVYDPKVMADPFGKPLPANVHTLADALAAKLITSAMDNPWQVSGYQYDIVAPAMTGMAQFYEGQGSRFILTNPGNIVETFPGGVVTIVGTIQAEGAPTASVQFSKPEDWNQAEIIARGHVFIHMQNGHILTLTTDDDPVRFAKSGMLSVQCEGGSISYKNLYLRLL